MRITRFNESVSTAEWEGVFLSIYDSFFYLEEQKICRIKYHAGICWIHSGHTSQMNFFAINNGEIVGDREGFNSIMKIDSDKDRTAFSDSKFKMMFKIEIEPNIVEESPFKSSHSPSFYGKDANTFIKIIKCLESVKNRHRDYKLDISISNNISSQITLTFEHK